MDSWASANMNNNSIQHSSPSNPSQDPYVHYKRLFALAGIAFLFLLPQIVGQNWVSISSEMLILSVAASALNLIMGYTGMISFGPAGLYAIGAYTTALILIFSPSYFLYAMIAGPVVASAVAFVVGWFCVRRTAVYFALLTLAFSQLIHAVIYKWYRLTGGDDGIIGIPIPAVIATINGYYYFAAICTLMCLFALYLITQSAFGKALTVIRENPGRAEFIGINVRKYQLIAFVIQGFFLGCAGSLLCVFSKNVFPTIANWPKSVEMIIACLLGGMYHFLGPFVGSALYIFLDHVVSGSTEYWSLVLGLLIVFLVLFFKNGFAGFIASRLRIDSK